MNESTKASIRKYQREKREQVRLDVAKGTLAKYKAFAEKQGMSMTAFITALVEAEIAKDADFTSSWQAKIEQEQATAEREKEETVAAIKSEMKPPKL